MRSSAALVLSTAILLAACEENASTGSARDASTHSMTTSPDIIVGPIPGPEKDVPQISNPYEQEAAVLQDGRRLFLAMNCDGCHGGHGGGGMGPSLRDPDWIYGGTDPHIFDSIAAGRAYGMPAWGRTLPATEIWKMVTYIRSLRTGREPDAPR